MPDATNREATRHPVTIPSAPARSTASPQPTAEQPPPTPALPGSSTRSERHRWRIPTDPPPV